MKMILLPKSSNAKTGNVIQSYSSRSTCPERLVVNNTMTFEDITEAIAESYNDTDQWEATDKAKTIMMELDDDDE